MSNPYTLNVVNDPIPYPFKYLKSACTSGVLGNEPFTVNMVSPKMIVCNWHPGMDEVAYSEDYEDYMADCQKVLQRVTG